jgi:hypothetical protein
MIISLSDWQQIISNPCGGFDYREAKRNKSTGENILRENGNPYWVFVMYMPTLGQLLVKIHEKQWHISTEKEADIQRIIEESQRIEDCLLAAVRGIESQKKPAPVKKKPAPNQFQPRKGA